MNDELEELIVTAFKLGMMDGASDLRYKPSPIKALKEVQRNIEAYISKRERQARIDELNKIEEAQQDDDKWGQFSMYDSSDFSNYITQRKSKLNIGENNES